MRLSVIIPTYNREQDLENCVQSLRYNSRDACEILLLSSELSPALSHICTKYFGTFLEDKSRANGKRVKSLWGIINQGIDAAKGDFVCWLNDDCIVHRDWDAIALSYFEATVGIVVLRTKGINRGPDYEIRSGYFSIPIANYAILRKSTGVRFDPHYTWFYGDADISLQMARQTGLRVVGTRENLVVHAHRMDDQRQENENDPRTFLDRIYFDRKWRLRKRVGEWVVEMNIFEKIHAIIREAAKNLYHLAKK